MELVGFVGSLAFLTSFCLMCGPLPSLYEGYKKMEAKSLTLEYLVIGCVQSFFWLAYGYKLDDFYTCLTNACCVTIFAFYMNALLYINRIMDKVYIYNGGVFAACFFISVILNGGMCLFFGSVFSSLWHFTMLKTMKQALSIKDASFINLPVSVVSLANFFAWWVYSLLTENYLMTVPNTVGIIMWSLNLVIYAWANLHVSHDFIVIKLLCTALSIEEVKVNPTPREPLLNNLKTATGRLNF